MDSETRPDEGEQLARLLLVPAALVGFVFFVFAPAYALLQRHEPGEVAGSEYETQVEGEDVLRVRFADGRELVLGEHALPGAPREGSRVEKRRGELGYRVDGILHAWEHRRLVPWMAATIGALLLCRRWLRTRRRAPAVDA